MKDLHSSEFRGRYEPDKSIKSSQSSSSTSSISGNLNLLVNNKDCILCAKTKRIPKLVFSSIYRMYITIGVILVSSRIASILSPILQSESHTSISPNSTSALDQRPMIQQALIDPNKKSILKRRNKSIPYIIHQSHEEGSSRPLEYANVEIIWKTHVKSNYNVQVEYRYWTNRDMFELIREYYPWFLSIYESYAYPIQRYHAAKYFILLKYGGFYVDLNILPIRNVLDLFHTVIQDEDDQEVIEMIIAQTYHKDKYTNSLFASIPNSSLLLAFTHSILPRASTITKATTIDDSTSSSSILSNFWKKLIFHTISRSAITEETVGSKIFTKFLNSRTNKRKWNSIPPYVWGQVCDPCQSIPLFCNKHNQEASFITTSSTSYNDWESIYLHYFQCHMELILWMYLFIFLSFMFIFRFLAKNLVICKRRNVVDKEYSRETRPLMIRSSNNSMMRVRSCSSIFKRISLYLEKKISTEEFLVCIVITLLLVLL